MNKYFPLIVALLFLSAAAKIEDLKFYILAANWQGSLCALDQCDSRGVEDYWNIHGLWPSDGKIGLGYCTDEAYDPKQTEDIRGELNKYWNGLYSDENALHAHEWTRHGTCSSMNINTYFKTALKLTHEYNIYKALAEQNIVPGNKKYKCTDVAAALTKKFGVDSFFVQAAPTGELSQVMLCLDKSLKIQNCPKPGICNGTISYPK